MMQKNINYYHSRKIVNEDYIQLSPYFKGFLAKFEAWTSTMVPTLSK